MLFYIIISWQKKGFKNRKKLNYSVGFTQKIVSMKYTLKQYYSINSINVPLTVVSRLKKNGGKMY